MLASDVRLGLRVRRNSGASSFVRDNHSTGQLKGRRTGFIISDAQRVAGTSHREVMIQWEGSTLSERVLIHRLEALPSAEQPVALGGEWVADEATFTAKQVRADQPIPSPH